MALHAGSRVIYTQPNDLEIKCEFQGLSCMGSISEEEMVLEPCAILKHLETGDIFASPLERIKEYNP